MRNPQNIAALAGLLALSPVVSSAQVVAAAGQPVTKLPEVTVSATRIERPVQDSPVDVTVFEAADIERNLMKDLIDLGRYEPGISVSNNPGRFGATSFNIRGISGNRILMQVDGVRVPDAFTFGSFGGANRSVVDVDALKIVEVLRGPGSSLYGSDAIGGVVTFLTKDPADYMALTKGPFYAGVKGGYASADKSASGTATLAMGRDSVQGMLVYTHRKGEETENMGSIGGTGSARTEPNPQDYKSENVLGKLVFRLGANNKVNVVAEHFRFENSTDVLTLNGSTPRTTTINGDDESTRDRISVAYERLDPRGSWFDSARAQVYFQEAETLQRTFEQRTATTATCSGVTAGTNTCNFARNFEFKQRIAGANLQAEKASKLGGWDSQLVYGLDISRTHTTELRDGVRTNITTGATTSAITPDNFPARDFPVSDSTLLGVFVQDELRSGAWSIIPGLRYDHFNIDPKPDNLFTKDNPGIVPVEKTDSAVSPKIGVLFRASPALTYFGNYAFGFRAPPYNDVNIGFTNLAFGYTAIPNPELKAEKSRGAEAGFRVLLDRSSFGITAFHNRYRDFIASLQSLTCPGDPRCSTQVPVTFQSINLGSVRIYGIEGRGEAALGAGFTALGSFGWAKGDDTARDQPLNSVDPLKVVLGASWASSDDRWGARLLATGVGRKKRIDQTGTPLVASPGFAIVDFIGRMEIARHLSINAGVFNITDRKYFLWSDLQGVGGGTASLPGIASLDRFSQPGRNARISLTYQF